MDLARKPTDSVTQCLHVQTELDGPVSKRTAGAAKAAEAAAGENAEGIFPEMSTEEANALYAERKMEYDAAKSAAAQGPRRGQGGGGSGQARQ